MRKTEDNDYDRDDNSFLASDAGTFYDLASGPPDPRAGMVRRNYEREW
jgi:hypothetical protein